LAVFSPRTTSSLFVGVALLFPVLLFLNAVQHYTRTSFTIGASGLLMMGILFGAGYPLWYTYFPDQVVHHSFVQEGEHVAIPAQNNERTGWVMEVHGSLLRGSNAYSAEYEFKIEPDSGIAPLTGSIERTWNRVRVGRKSMGRELTDVDRHRHTFEVSATISPQLVLHRLSGTLAGPLQVTLRAIPVTFNYLLVLIIPLILLLSVYDIYVEAYREVFNFTWLASSLLIFSYLFSHYYMEDAWFKPFLQVLVIAVLTAFGLGWLIPRLLRPLLRGFLKKRGDGESMKGRENA